MCLAVYSPDSSIIPMEHLRQGFDGNPDGAGFAVADGRSVHIHKGFFTFAQFARSWERFAKLQLPCAVHFRWATHGSMSVDNCHPHKIANDCAMIHNGILPIRCTGDRSDTAEFTERILQRMHNRGRLRDLELLSRIESRIGIGNKIVILHGDGTADLLNEQGGVWQGGVWYSNNGFQPPAKKYWMYAADWQMHDYGIDTASPF